MRELDPVLVLAELTDGVVSRSTRALLTLARRFGTPEVVLCGPAGDDTLSVLGRYGAPIVRTLWGPGVEEHPTAACVEALVALAVRTPPAAILLPADHAGHEIAARVAIRLDAGLISDAIDVRPDDSGLVATQSPPGGTHRVESTVVRGVPVCTVRTEAVPLVPAPVTARARPFALDLPPHARAVRLVERTAVAPGQRPDLATAAVVVAGGRGVGSQDLFDLVGELADELGGALGGSHTATELGWCPRHAQIDQTGCVIHPDLYLALGISGSVRHRAAVPDAGAIVAVDRDPAAPIFTIADLGVVGDLRDVVPELLAEVRRRKSRPHTEV
ncbi:electron transfer flavoprotein subunit alpha [Virgisporangium aliadipatigenens]|uniref:Electron transfer flavoprotein subunit alpha n=1 Tax=Virgisporangium aliadipatigenens TaxID=741659 RepID=A0A8J3YLW6_9ACTN|nr:electron transfer flavoprotein subunit alpha/FixB family protein [Virgisporangium aliadipatigenens]GIJ46266.1 electron transfer flavoprotein subunit alpha [Virgisporangium aliadipatigenens]